MAYLSPMFGRADDMDFVLQRVRQPGLTVIAGRPGQGKSRLLEEMRDALASGNDPAHGDDGFLVGYCEAARDESNILRRALEDLYKRWLQNASYLEQARRVWGEESKNIVDKFGELASKIGDLVSKSKDPARSAAGWTVSGLFTWLVRADQRLKGEMIGFDPPIGYEQTRQVLACLHAITKKRAIVILDAFERSGRIASDADNLDLYLKHVDHWPPCHFFLAVRQPAAQGDEGEVAGYREAQKLKKAHGRLVTIRELARMDLSAPAEADRVVAAIRSSMRNPADWFDSLGRDEVLKLLDGYPKTLKDWLYHKPDSEAAFRQICTDARQHRSRHLEHALDELCSGDRTLFRVALRLAILPEMRDDTWATLRPIVLDGVDDPADALADLQRKGILQCQEPPSFGHTTDHDAAQRFAVESDSIRAFAPEQAKYLILSLARRIDPFDSKALPITAALLSLAPLAWQIHLDNGYVGLTLAPLTLFQDSPVREEQMSLFAPAAAMAQHDRGLASVAGMAIVNSIGHFQSARWEVLLDELRGLSRAHANDAALTGLLAAGLFNAVNRATGDQAESLLEELRTLSRVHPDKATVRRVFANALVNAFRHATADQAGVLLEELRTLSQMHVDDAAVRGLFAMGLVNALNDAMEDRADVLLQELRALSQMRRDDVAVQETLSKGLFNAFNNATGDRAEALLEELRELGRAYPDNTTVRQQLADGLFNAFNNATGDRAEALLEELRELGRAYPDNTTVRQRLADGLFNAFNRATGDRADILLDELRASYRAHRDEALRKLLARGLGISVLRYARASRESDATAALDELRDLREANPNDEGVSDIFQKVRHALGHGD